MAVDQHTRGSTGESTDIAGESARNDGATSEVAKLRETLEEREELLSILSHDLRNPLAAIKLATAVLARQGQPPEARARTVERIGSNTERMLRILDDLVEFSHLADQSPAPLEPTSCDLTQICRAAMASVAASHPRREVQLSSPGPVLGSFDEARLSRAIASLLARAVEHGPADYAARVVIERNPHTTVRIEHPALEEIEAELRLVLESDQGITLRRSSPMRHKASDLGLYVARQVVAAHGGSVSLNTRPDVGLHFSIRLPSDPSGH